MTTDVQSLPGHALIIGASRGLGLAVAEEYLKRGWHVIATERSTSGGLERLVKDWPGQLFIEKVDINLQDQISSLHDRLAPTMFDLLFINAGVKNNDKETIADVSTDEFIRVMTTNALSPFRVIETLDDLVKRDGTIGLMSSGQGSISNNETGGYEVYRGSKAALNMFMRSYAARHNNDERALLLMAPGWVRTDMGGPDATLSISESIPTLVDTIQAQYRKSGLQYLDRFGDVIPW